MYVYWEGGGLLVWVNVHHVCGCMCLLCGYGWLLCRCKFTGLWVGGGGGLLVWVLNLKGTCLLCGYRWWCGCMFTGGWGVYLCGCWTWRGVHVCCVDIGGCCVDVCLQGRGQGYLCGWMYIVYVGVHVCCVANCVCCVAMNGYCVGVCLLGGGLNLKGCTCLLCG